MKPEFKITLSSPELKALIGACSRDEARVNLCKIAVAADGRACATDGHRLILTWTDGSRHDQKPDDLRYIPRDFALSLAKIAKATHAIEFVWDTPNDLTATVRGKFDAVLTTAKTVIDCPSVCFPPWNQVIPPDSQVGGVRVAMNAKYLAEAATVLAKATGQENIHVHLGGALDPIVVEAPEGDRMWAYVIMPVRTEAFAGDEATTPKAPTAPAPAPAAPAPVAAKPRRAPRKANPAPAPVPVAAVRLVGPDGATLYTGPESELDAVWPLASREGSGCSVVAA
jgi:hypothetical protein